MRTKKELIKKLLNIGELKIRQGIDFKELAYSIEQHKEEKTFKEWFNFIQNISFIKEDLKK